MSTTFQINKKVRDAFILNLRRIFTGDPVYPYKELPNGNYDFDPNTGTKIIISDAIPTEPAFYPAIVVDTVFGTETRYLGPEDLFETKDVDNVTIEDKKFASLDLTVNLSVFTAGDTIARDEILDRIYDQFKLITEDLAESGIEIKDTTFNQETRLFQNNRWYVTARLTINVYTEWEDELGVGDTIASIPIDMTLDLTPYRKI